MGFAALRGYPVKNNEVSFKFCEHPKFRSKFYTDREYNSFILRVLVRQDVKIEADFSKMF